MSDMVERVAKAICLAASGRAQASDDYWSHIFGPERSMYRRLAIEAIMAMREPTASMKQQWRGEEHTGFQPSCHMCGGHLQGWRIMIDAALADDKQPKDLP